MHSSILFLSSSDFLRSAGGDGSRVGDSVTPVRQFAASATSIDGADAGKCRGAGVIVVQALTSGCSGETVLVSQCST